MGLKRLSTYAKKATVSVLYWYEEASGRKTGNLWNNPERGFFFVPTQKKQAALFLQALLRASSVLLACLFWRKRFVCSQSFAAFERLLPVLFPPLVLA